MATNTTTVQTEQVALHEMPSPQRQNPDHIPIEQDAAPPSYPGNVHTPNEKANPQAPFGPDSFGNPDPNRAGPQSPYHQPAQTPQGGPQYPQQSHPGMTYQHPSQQQQNRMVVPLDQLSSEHSQDIDCPYCKRQTRTRVQQEHSSMTFVIGILLGICCICLACVPCLAHWAQDIDWYCDNCNKRVATRPNGGVTQPVATPENRYVQSQYGAQQQQQGQQPQGPQQQGQQQGQQQYK